MEKHFTKISENIILIHKWYKQKKILQSFQANFDLINLRHVFKCERVKGYLYLGFLKLTLNTTEKENLVMKKNLY